MYNATKPSKQLYTMATNMSYDAPIPDSTYKLQSNWGISGEFNMQNCGSRPN